MGARPRAGPGHQHRPLSCVEGVRRPDGEQQLGGLLDEGFMGELYEVATSRKARRCLQHVCRDSDVRPDDETRRSQLVEVLSPPRFTIAACQHGMRVCSPAVLDITMGWDIRQR